jgi:uncharacterized protein YecE (DUF72 family)
MPHRSEPGDEGTVDQMIRVGTSGWLYRDWRGELYEPGLPQARWLERYAESFTTVEVNASFYRLPERATFERWRDGTPERFVFSLKASRYLTHLKRLLDPAQGLERFRDHATGLGAKLGPVLFQLPPGFAADPTRLEAFLAAVPAELRGAWEFRDRSWVDRRGLHDARRCRPRSRDRTPTGPADADRRHRGLVVPAVPPGADGEAGVPARHPSAVGRTDSGARGA